MPTLETERLVLRPWRADDVDAIVALNGDREVMRWIPPFRPMTRDESEALLERIVAHWDAHRFGLWALEAREDPSAGVIGFAGLAVPAFLPEVLPTVEVGWRIASPWWGRGLATEAARAGVDHAFGPLALPSVVSIIDPGNAASLRVAGKLGMERDRDRLHPRSGRRLRVMRLDARVAS